jgi:serine phosphatase RsbU (regulator of sigma subunit)
MFATVFVGQFDPANGRLVYANAGHSPVIFCPAEYKPMFIEADSEPMGILPKTTATERTIFLKSGDLLVVGSDGLYEVHNEGRGNVWPGSVGNGRSVPTHRNGPHAHQQGPGADSRL